MLDGNPSVREDVNFFSIAGDGRFTYAPDLSFVNSDDYSSILKISTGAHDIDVTGLVVPAGHETAVDICRATNITLRGKFGTGPVRPDNVIRVKGPFRNIKLAGFLYARGGRDGIDIEVGNHYDQDSGLGRGLDLRGLEAHSNGDRVTLAVGWVVPFTVKYKREYVEYLIWQSIRLKAYVLAKHIVRRLLRIPAGVKGPSWM